MQSRIEGERVTELGGGRRLYASIGHAATAHSAARRRPTRLLIDLKGEHPRSAGSDPCEPTVNGFALQMRHVQDQVGVGPHVIKGRRRTMQLPGAHAAVACRDTCRWEKEGRICTNRPSIAQKTADSSVQGRSGVGRRAHKGAGGTTHAPLLCRLVGGDSVQAVCLWLPPAGVAPSELGNAGLGVFSQVNARRLPAGCSRLPFELDGWPPPAAAPLRFCVQSHGLDTNASCHDSAFPRVYMRSKCREQAGEEGICACRYPHDMT